MTELLQPLLLWVVVQPPLQQYSLLKLRLFLLSVVDVVIHDVVAVAVAIAVVVVAVATGLGVIVAAAVIIDIVIVVDIIS